MKRRVIQIFLAVAIMTVVPGFSLMAAQEKAAPIIKSEGAAATTITSSAPQPGLLERDRLTGDWGGARSRLKASGVTFDLDFTQFYQGLVSGYGPNKFEYGGRLDGFVKLDTGALGLWKGGGLHSHIEYRFGDLPGSLGGTFFPTTSGMQFSSDCLDTLVASSLYLSQRFGDRTSLLIGKINVLDLLENDLFFGGWGNHRFMNTIFVAPPSGLVPPVFYGAIVNVRMDPVTLSLWVYDPVDRPQDDWPDDLFDDGVTLYFTPTYTTQIDSRTTTFSLVGIYTTKSGIEFGSLADEWQPGGFKAGLEPSTKEGSYSIGFQFSHLLHQNPGNPRQGWGVFLKGAISDGNPNYVQNSIIAGIGGTGLFRGRELDSFGAGYFYYNLSDDLQDALNLNQKNEDFGDEQGFEVYYSYAVTPWLYIAGDLQVIDPPRESRDNAVIAGLRTMIKF
jgi:porin